MLDWKNFMPEELSRNQSTLRFDVILQHDWPIEQCLPHMRVFFGRKTKSLCFDLFIHWLMKQITNTDRNHFSRSYENRSSWRKWGKSSHFFWSSNTHYELNRLPIATCPLSVPLQRISHGDIWLFFLPNQSIYLNACNPCWRENGATQFQCVDKVELLENLVMSLPEPWTDDNNTQTTA